MRKNILYEEMAKCLNMSASTFYGKVGNQTYLFFIRDDDIIKKSLISIIKLRYKRKRDGHGDEKRISFF